MFHFQSVELEKIRKAHTDVVNSMFELDETNGEVAEGLQQSLTKFEESYEEVVTMLNALPRENLPPTSGNQNPLSTTGDSGSSNSGLNSGSFQIKETVREIVSVQSLPANTVQESTVEELNTSIAMLSRELKQSIAMMMLKT